MKYRIIGFTLAIFLIFGCNTSALKNVHTSKIKNDLPKIIFEPLAEEVIKSYAIENFGHLDSCSLALIEAQKLIGSTIFRLQGMTSQSSPIYGRLITNKSDVFVDAPYFSQYKVIGIDRNNYGFGYYAPYEFRLIVITPNNEEGLLAYHKRNISISDPLFQFNEKDKNSILNNEIYIGMSEMTVKLAWGNPYKVNRTINKDHTTEFWFYPENKRLIFIDGILDTIQE